MLTVRRSQSIVGVRFVNERTNEQTHGQTLYFILCIFSIVRRTTSFSGLGFTIVLLELHRLIVISYVLMINMPSRKKSINQYLEILIICCDISMIM